ncbi:MAG: excinuclease ABC subunit A [Rhodobiaceae bacterium]|nr:excinuclease ABC subunit A [Rhodobiaceae bacterium]
MSKDYLKVKGAKEHNLKNISVDIPKNKFVVITGLSGSGKSSLAFDTIYAEGQRRYVESLSAYARQFLGQMEKPNVESIEGLSPAIAIDQKTSSRSPRSTVGTVTEVHDYLRLLWARIGISFCPICGTKIIKQSVEFIVNQVLNIGEDINVEILAPVVKSRKGEFENLFKDLLKEGFSRAYIDGELTRLDEAKKLDRYFNHDISVVVDRVKIKKTGGRRLPQSIEAALKLTDGVVDIKIDDEIKNFSQNLGCKECGISYGELEPRDFSFNSPFGACNYCNGLGVNYEIDENLLLKDKTLSINENVFPEMSFRKYFRAQIHGVCEYFEIPKEVPYEELSKNDKEILLYGTDGIKTPINYTNRFGNSRSWKREFPGVIPLFKKIYEETSSDKRRDHYMQFMRELDCGECDGERLNERSRNVKVKTLTLGEFNKLSIKKSYEVIDNLKLTGNSKEIAEAILREIKERLSFLNEVGLGYLQLNRGAATLSGGEAQRIRLATQIGSGLTGVLYVLDEPSIGLHQSDNKKLIDTLLKLKNLGNTVLVVEHDEETMKSSDYLIDIGWGAGEDGGNIVAAGDWDTISKNKKSITGRYLSGKLKVPYPKVRRNGNEGKIVIRGAKENNLKNITAEFPLGKFVSVTGVSGSGKSTLVSEILAKAINNEFTRKNWNPPGVHKSISGLNYIDKLIEIDQSPIGRTPRSNPATYSGVFDMIRNLYSLTEESKIRGYKPGRFSFNVPGGRCESCKGDGTIKVEMYFLPDVYVMCEDCDGSRYNPETLSIKWKGYSIADILNSTVENALKVFENQPKIHRIIKTLDDVGLSYITLGQSATTLSGGEAQRVKLAKELSKRSTGKTMYILDEPTTGLHFADVQKLMEVLHMLVDKGNTVVVIEHNLDVIKNSDWIIDLGPEGGENGGKIITEGTPESVIGDKKSLTGKHLKLVL